MDHDPVSGEPGKDSPPPELVSPWGPDEAKAPPKPPRRAPSGWTKKAGLGAAAVVLAGGAFGVVWAVTSGSGGSSSASSAPLSANQSLSSGDPGLSSGGSGLAVDPGQSAPAPGHRGPGGFGLRGPFGRGPDGQAGKPTPSMAGTVKSVNNSVVTIQDFMGFTRTIHTSGSTTYTRGGQPATSSALTNGAQIAAQGTVDKNGTDLDASKVNVLLPRVAGTVQSVSGSSFVVQGADGATHTVTTTASTKFHQGRSTASLSDVKQGDRVVATGDESNGNLTASNVQILPPRPQNPQHSQSSPGAPGTPPAPPGGNQPGNTT